MRCSCSRAARRRPCRPGAKPSPGRPMLRMRSTGPAAKTEPASPRKIRKWFLSRSSPRRISARAWKVITCATRHGSPGCPSPSIGNSTSAWRSRWTWSARGSLPRSARRPTQPLPGNLRASTASRRKRYCGPSVRAGRPGVRGCKTCAPASSACSSASARRACAWCWSSRTRRRRSRCTRPSPRRNPSGASSNRERFALASKQRSRAASRFPRPRSRMPPPSRLPAVWETMPP
jgi:hypothetical protein